MYDDRGVLRMNVAVIGTGYWGTNHARVTSELAAEELIDEIVFCDKDESRVSSVASNYGAEYVTDHNDLKSSVDAAIVATPLTTHQEIANDLLESGIDCLVEKPLALNSDAAWDIVHTAERTGQTLAVGHIFRHHPALQALKARIDRGELGQIKYLHTNRFSFRVPRETSGVLHQLAIHDIDIYRYLFGANPDRIYCRLSNWIREGIDETAVLTLDFGDAVGTINESWQVPVFGKQRELIVIGTERAVYLDYLEDTELELFDTRIRKQNGLQAVNEGSMTIKTEDREPLRTEVLDFLEASQSGETPSADGRVGAEVIELLEIAEEADKRRAAISVDQ